MRVLTLNRGAERVMRQNEAGKPDELWQGSAYAMDGEDDSDVPIYLRLSTPLPVVAELLCAVIGRSVGLPVPEPFLVAVHRGALPGSKMIDPAAEVTWTFASEDVGGDTFAQMLRDDSASAQAMIRRWEHLVPVATFDEWMANPDRNFGNILFVANSLWIIDHAEAFGGSVRKLFELEEIKTDAFTNKVGQLLSDGFNAAERLQHLNAAHQWVKHPASSLSIPEAFACAGIERWQTDEQQQELIDFVTSRLTLTHSLLCNRLGHPQLTLPPARAAGAALPANGPSSSSRPS